MPWLKVIMPSYLSVIPSFTEIEDFACRNSYGEYRGKKEAHFACANDPNCQFVQSDEYLRPNGLVRFKLCRYGVELRYTASSRIYKKPDVDRSGNRKNISMLSNDTSI